MRFLADLPDEDVRWLDLRAKEHGKSRAALIREAVAQYRIKPGEDWLDQAFGIWKNRDDIADGVEHQRRLRAEWVREWDPEYGGDRFASPEDDAK